MCAGQAPPTFLYFSLFLSLSFICFIVLSFILSLSFFQVGQTE